MTYFKRLQVNNTLPFSLPCTQEPEEANCPAATLASICANKGCGSLRDDLEQQVTLPSWYFQFHFQFEIFPNMIFAWNTIVITEMGFATFVIV